MTMVPAQNISKQPHHIIYAHAAAANTSACGYPDVMTPLGDGFGYANHIVINTNLDHHHHPISFLGSDLGINHSNIIMGDQEEQSRTSNSSTTLNNEATAAASSSSNKRSHQDTSWLQLGLGDSLSKTPLHHHHHLDRTQTESTAQTVGGGGLMLELNLGGGGGSSTSRRELQQTTLLAPEFRVPQRPRGDYGSFGSTTSSNAFPTFLSPSVPLVFPYQQQQQQQIMNSDQMGWGLFNVNHQLKPMTSPFLVGGSSTSVSPSSSSSASLMPQGQAGCFLTRPFMAVDAPDSEFKLIHPPPPRLHSGIWFLLQASLHQAKQPYLPQVPKSFLRIKDGRMTVRLVMKYVSNKLGLDSESEVEVRCRGQALVPSLTLQHVRDQIWSSRDALTLLSTDSSDHLMVLHYGRSSISST